MSEQLLCDVCGREALLKGVKTVSVQEAGGKWVNEDHYSCGDHECLLAVQDEYDHWETLVKVGPREVPIVKPLQSIKGGGREESAPPSTDHSNLETIISQLNYRVTTLEPFEQEVNNIALFLREHYQDEIRSKQPQHQGSISACVIYYLNKEREHGLVGLVRKIRRILSNG